MKEMGWSHTEMMDTPYTVYLRTRRIINIEKKEEKKEQENQKKKIESKKP